jgi:uncharacterized protein (TIGR03437 family)
VHNFVRQERKSVLVRVLIFAVPVVASVLSQAQISLAMSSGVVVGAADNLDTESFGLARGSLFSYYGTNLAPSAMSASGLPLPTQLNGITVTIVTAAGQLEAPLLYVSPNQINAILPSAVPEGVYLLTVNLNGVAVSQSQNITVTTARFGAFTRSQLGFGPAVLQQYDHGRASLNGLMHPAATGQAVVLWGTGLGPLPSGSDAAAPGVVDLSNNVMISVGGVLIKPFYAGRSPQFPGVDQINFYLPSSLPARCYVPMTVYLGELPSAVLGHPLIISGPLLVAGTLIESPSIGAPPLTLSVGTPDSACTSELGLSPAQIQRLDEGGTVRLAVMAFDSYTGPQLQGGLHTQISQSGEAWLGDYDAENLSLVVTGWQMRLAIPVGFCERQGFTQLIGPPDAGATGGLINSRVYGVTGNNTTLSLKVNGIGGCAWTTAPTLVGGVSAEPPSNCVASSYMLNGSAGGVSLFSVSGALPAPRQLAASDQLSVANQSSGGLQANWNVADFTPDDQMTLGLISSQTIGGIFPTATVQSSVACAVSFGDKSFLVEPTDMQWLRQVSTPGIFIRGEQVSMSVLSGALAGVPSPRPAGSPDLFVLLIRNQLMFVPYPDPITY